MKTKTTDANSASTTEELSVSTIFGLLSDQRRRYLLRYLSKRVGDVRLGELAEQLALWEGEPTHDRYERIYTGLVHVHVPKLFDSGVIRFDTEQETVALTEAADALHPHLELTASADVH